MKNPIQSLGAVLLAGVLLFSTTTASRAAGAATTPARITEVTADSVTVRNGVNRGLKLTEVATDGTRTVRAASNVETYKVTGFTTILVNNLPAKIGDLKSGMQVSVRVSLDPKIAAAITAVDLPPAQQSNRSPGVDDTHWKTRSLATAIDAYKVRAVGADTVTVAQDGGKKSIAYKVRPITQITVDGAKSQIGQVRVGMEVVVVASTDPQVAATIAAKKVK